MLCILAISLVFCYQKYYPVKSLHRHEDNLTSATITEGSLLNYCLTDLYLVVAQIVAPPQVELIRLQWGLRGRTMLCYVEEGVPTGQGSFHLWFWKGELIPMRWSYLLRWYRTRGYSPTSPTPLWILIPGRRVLSIQDVSGRLVGVMMEHCCSITVPILEDQMRRVFPV